MKIKLLVSVLAISILTITGCKKSKVTPTPTPDPPVVPTTATRAELSKILSFYMLKKYTIGMMHYQLIRFLIHEVIPMQAQI